MLQVELVNKVSVRLCVCVVNIPVEQSLGVAGQ